MLHRELTHVQARAPQEWRMKLACAAVAIFAALMAGNAMPAQGATYQVYVTNEKSGDVTVIDGGDLSITATIPVGKRPRGIHVSPDGKTVYVALSGTPIEAPPQIDANGNPVFEKKKGNDDDDANADKAADGIGVLNVATRKLIGKLQAGSDPEEFALSKDGRRIYISNEDTKTASVINIAAAKLEHIVPVGQEPEGVTTTPDGKQFYVTCEAGGDIYVVDTASYTAAGHFKVNGRPRSVAFLSSGGIGFIPSESAGELNVIDAVNAKVLKTIALPAGSRPMRAILSPDEKRLYISNGRAGTISVFDAHSYELLDTIKVGTRPWGIGVSPDGKFLFAANGPSNDVSVVDLKTNREVNRIRAGSSPWGIAVTSR
ncbi:MAG: beta-propeller fold lactonase family protein [Pseudomonadota bacterium]|nr:beta-propeller fold lactonase family protein [Pseudomonadota bacterium]